jgi:hypothetical protein
MHLKSFLVAFATICAISVFGQKSTAPPASRTPQPIYSAPPDVLGELREKWNLSIGMELGASMLTPKIDFQRTPMLDLYNYIVSLPSTEDLTWEQFEKDNDFKKTILQPRFGFSALLTYGNVPAFVRGEFISSTSSFQKMSYGVTVGLGKDILFGYEEDTYFSFRGGYKILLHDAGFGSETLVNSVGNKEAQKYMERFFDPKNAIGSPRGDLLTMRFGLGKYVGKDKKTNMGLEVYGELDLTNETLRIARMNSAGIGAYVNFVLF